MRTSEAALRLKMLPKHTTANIATLRIDKGIPLIRGSGEMRTLNLAPLEIVPHEEIPRKEEIKAPESDKRPLFVVYQRRR